MDNVTPPEPESKAIREKIIELSKQRETCQTKLKQIADDIEALERTERLLFGAKKTTSYDSKRDELRKIVLETLKEAPLHYGELAEKTSAKIGKEISKGAMYNFLVRSIIRNDAPIEKDEKEGFYRLKIENSANNKTNAVGV